MPGTAAGLSIQPHALWLHLALRSSRTGERTERERERVTLNGERGERGMLRAASERLDRLEQREQRQSNHIESRSSSAASAATLSSVPRPSMDSVAPPLDRGSVVSFADVSRSDSVRTRLSRDLRVSAAQKQRKSAADDQHTPRRHRAMPVRNVDLKVAWHADGHAEAQDLPKDIVNPMMRLVQRTRSECVWELVDDPGSSRLAWWISLLMKVLTVSSVIISNLQISEETILEPGLAAALETSFDVLFLLEFVARLCSTPSRGAFMRDPYNWADLASALALVFRASIGFVIRTPAPSVEERNIQVMLLFVLPVVRFLKLLRYFDSFRLLVDAIANSFACFPVLLYTMALILLIAANCVYLAEERSNIPSLPHSHWLALVTMTTVGYGDYTPKTFWGYVCVGTLSMVSTCFVAMPVGIIGREVSHLWETRRYILLVTRVRKCLWKWGVAAKDLRVLFEYVDVDGDGQLSLHEFMELMQQMRIGMKHANAKDLFNLFDDDGNGQIDYHEFLRHVCPDEAMEDSSEIQRAIRDSSALVSEAISVLTGKSNPSRSLASGSVTVGQTIQTIEETDESDDHPDH